jgi:hypothetical protein
VDELFTLYNKKGAWSVDIGVWGPQMLPREAKRVIESLNGKLISIKVNQED